MSSPPTVGFPKYGAFIPPELFGSEFFMGRLTKQASESRICFLEGEGVWEKLGTWGEWAWAKMVGSTVSAQSCPGPGWVVGRVRLWWWGTLFLLVSAPGIWSNLYAANLQDSLYWSSEPSQFWDRWAQARGQPG